MISVLIVEGQFLVGQGLRRLLEGEYCAVYREAGNACDALSQVDREHPDVTILDMDLPENAYLRILGAIRRRAPAASVLMTSAQRDSRHARRAYSIGATGHVSKAASREEILQAVADVIDGKSHFGGVQVPGNTHSLLPVLDNLSPREHFVMLALGAGKRPVNIAAELNLNIRTISTYKRRIMEKLYLNSTAALAGYHKLLNAPRSD